MEFPETPREERSRKTVPVELITCHQTQQHENTLIPSLLLSLTRRHQNRKLQVSKVKEPLQKIPEVLWEEVSCSVLPK